MNIRDFVKFDERTVVAINKTYGRRIQKMSEKFSGSGEIYLEKLFALEKERDDILNDYQKRNVPVKEESLLMQMAIEWGEANTGMTFTKAIADVYSVLNFNNEGDLLKDTGSVEHEEISIEDAKLMLKAQTGTSVLPESILLESLKILNPKLNKSCVFETGPYKNSLTIDGTMYDIPTMSIKKIIGESAGITRERYSDIKEYIDALSKVRIPETYSSWPM